jgi:IS30 family transposase
MKHLTAEQRYAISLLLQQGKTQKEIAKIIGKHKSTVSREIARNQDKRSGKYNYELAERKYRQRIREKPKKIHFTQAVKDFVESQLKEDLSPEQIVGVAKKEGIACVSHERIYQHVWEDKKKGGRLYMHLRTQGKRYRKRGQKKDQRGIIPNRVDIDKRPKIVEEKTRVGDFEVDTIIGKNHQGALVTINDRKTGLVKIRKVNSKNAEQVAQAVIDALTPYKPFLHTITSDNGKEFALHAQISQHLGVEFFFAKPYHSWQRGANENLNGLIRQYFPKKTDFSTITDHQVQMVEEKLNNRPRKRFNFESPLYMFNLLTNSSKVAFVT